MELSILGLTATERVMRTLKAECFWLKEWTCLLAPIAALDTWITTDNEYDLHSVWGYRWPRPFEGDDDYSPSPPFLAA